MLIQVSKGSLTSRDKVIAYVNPYSVRHWKITNEKFRAEEVQIPTFFFGSSATRWTLQKDGSTTYIQGSDMSFDELVQRGYEHKVLWLGMDLESWLDNVPLEWPHRL